MVLDFDFGMVLVSGGWFCGLVGWIWLYSRLRGVVWFGYNDGTAGLGGAPSLISPVCFGFDFVGWFAVLILVGCCFGEVLAWFG